MAWLPAGILAAWAARIRDKACLAKADTRLQGPVQKWLLETLPQLGDCSDALTNLSLASVWGLGCAIGSA